MNVHKYITQHVKSPPVQKSQIPRSIQLTHPMVQNNSNNNLNNNNSNNNNNNNSNINNNDSSWENFTQDYDNDDDDDDENDYYLTDRDENGVDDEEQKELDRLRIRFISISSVSSSAFTPSTSSDSMEENNPTSSKPPETNLPNQLRARSNTLETLEEEKRVRWYDEHFGTLISNIYSATSPPSDSSTPSTTSKTILPLETHSYPIKPSSSFEMLANNSPNLIQQKSILFIIFIILFY